MSLTQQLKDNPLVRCGVDFVFARGDFVRPVVQQPIIRQFIGTGPLGVVLDNGCGRGMYTPMLLKQATAYYGIDFGSDNIETLKRRFRHHGEQAQFQTASATALPFEDTMFDFVLFCEVLEHIADDHRAIAEVNRVLKPGGRMVLSVPVPPAPIEDKEHVREGYTLPQLEALLGEHGLRVRRHEYCMYGITKALIRCQANTRSGWLPGFAPLPLYLETWFHLRPGLPYDIVLDVEKPAE